MSGVTLSFHTDQNIARRLTEIASEEDVSVSRLVRHLLVPGLVLPAVGRRMLRRIVNEGGPEATEELRDHLLRALSVVSNRVLERKLLAEAVRRNPDGPKMTEDEIDEAAVLAVEEDQRKDAPAPRGFGY